ncbi:hypothetical protein METBIDRAFT_64421 [Metschnikowia bicuspidata var. bicuspidata NRRL YB-4993]|uniref:SAP domain-containing protein n=1 Tax=Metschnikowia bicuspidata var. bicuspidata NRRL YB-4993 TaxID=869754 RepID=A0A1A0HI46_9ASCO|nr:hypothetical protein METBIDRAFT_64421 [Metschnikowia bicuspidata var. bicuspidata NRRL YB-4993]OBA23557.1 hypothetical protein METBIDRAFT_64421 [Metschnikowia bicuspidata var. bicuspidata NRRL YB-4993]
MSQYASLTVAQLKDALKEKNLPTDGKKADLVARLEEAAPATEEAEPNTQENVEEQQPQQETSAPAEAGAEAEIAEAEDEKPNGSEEKKPEKKVLTPEERKALAVDLLTKKIRRAEKFGDEASATAAKQDMARVEKFGVDPSTALGKEIGALDRDMNSELATRKARRSEKKGNRVQKK